MPQQFLNISKISAVFSSNLVAKLCRNVWQLAFLKMPDSLIVARTALWIVRLAEVVSASDIGARGQPKSRMRKTSTATPVSKLAPRCFRLSA